MTETRAGPHLFSDSAYRSHASHPAMGLWDCHRPCPFHGDGFDGPVTGPAWFTEMALMLAVSSGMSRGVVTSPRDTSSSHSCAEFIRSVVSDPLPPRGLQPVRHLCPWGFSMQEYWSGLPCPPPGDRPNPGIEPRSPALQADSLPSETRGKPNEFLN